MRDSARELLLMLFCFLVTAVFYANIIFYAEYHEPTTFQTPFAGLWWAVVTMTTVGYGDVVPKSTLGKIIGSACAIKGLTRPMYGSWDVVVPIYINGDLKCQTLEYLYTIDGPNYYCFMFVVRM
jgi:hypothetical protein